MVVIEINRLIFKKKHIWFSDRPFDVDGCDAVFFFVCKERVSLEGFIRKEVPTFVIDLTQDLDAIWKRVSKRVRRYINQARREGVEVRVNQGFEEFKELFFRFAKQKGFKPPSEPLEVMMSHGTLFTAYYRDRMIAGMMTIEDENGGTVREFVRASIRLEAGEEIDPVVNIGNKLMVWEAIAHAKERGFKIYDFGGYPPELRKDDPRYSIKVFKERFGGEPVTYYNYTKYYSILYRLFKRLKG